MSNSDLILKLFLQLGVIIITCRLVSYIGVRYLKQTSVVCEMVAGIILGPSLFGAFLPELQSWIFPTEKVLTHTGETIANPSMIILYAISRIGIVCYMFVIGMRFDVSVLNNKVQNLIAVSLSGIIFPFFLAFCAVSYGYSKYDFFGPNITFFNSILFTGIALSITAFPILARILNDSNIVKTSLGSLTLGAGCLDDALSWCFLAILLALLKSNWVIASTTIGLSILYVTFMLTIGKSILARALSFESKSGLDNSTVATLLSMLMVSAWFSDFIGIHSIFGAFIAGIAMPRGKVVNALYIQIEPITRAFFVPIFFVYTGLNTQIGLVNTPELIYITLIIIGIASVGKGVGCTLGARWSGETWLDSLIVGSLMNARGLMELIILDIGLSIGIITNTFFTIMVLMAVTTTVIASPLYHWLLKKKKK